MENTQVSVVDVGQAPKTPSAEDLLLQLADVRVAIEYVDRLRLNGRGIASLFLFERELRQQLIKLGYGDLVRRVYEKPS